MGDAGWHGCSRSQHQCVYATSQGRMTRIYEGTSAARVLQSQMNTRLDTHVINPALTNDHYDPDCNEHRDIQCHRHSISGAQVFMGSILMSCYCLHWSTRCSSRKHLCLSEAMR